MDAGAGQNGRVFASREKRRFQQAMRRAKYGGVCIPKPNITARAGKDDGPCPADQAAATHGNCFIHVTFSSCIGAGSGSAPLLFIAFQERIGNIADNSRLQGGCVFGAQRGLCSVMALLSNCDFSYRSEEPE